MIKALEKKGLIFVLVSLAFTTGSLVAETTEKPWLATVPTESRLWHLGVYPFDEKKALSSITDIVALGFIPVGIETYSDNLLYVTFAKHGVVESREWTLINLGTADMINPQIQNFVEKGWLPLDIAFNSEGYFLLAVKSPVKVKEWRIFSAKSNDIEDVQNDIRAYSALGFQAMGLTELNGQLWVLEVKADQLLYKIGVLKAYKNDGSGFISGLQYEASQGRSPLGFSLAKDRIFALFNQ